MALGLALMIGESIRSFGMGRPFLNWFDDFIMAFFLFLGVYKTRRNVHNIKYLSAAFAFNLGLLLLSYSSKISNPARDIHSTMSYEILTTLLLIATITSFIGMIWTLSVNFSKS